jgi:predicted enzyme related to lactoylglutathione lyase
MVHFLGLQTVIYKVSDLEKAKAFYSKILGFEPYFDEPFYVGYSVAGFELGLQTSDTVSQPVDNVETYWGVADIHASYQSMLDDGAMVHTEPQNVGDDIWVATLRDPWGNIIGIIKNPHFK